MKLPRAQCSPGVCTKSGSFRTSESLTSRATSILIVAEVRDGNATPLTRELLGLARDFAPAGEVAALLIAADSTAAESLITYGADRVLLFEHGGAEEYEGELWLAAAERIVTEINPRAVFAGHTSAGADLGPRLAVRLQSAVATACVAVEVEDGELLFTRACYGGNVRETISIRSAPAVATIKAGVGVMRDDPTRRGDIVRMDAAALAPRTRVVARERDEASGTNLEDARIIVAGGRGLEGPEGFQVLQNLAQVLGAAVGASRVPCDLGWCPHSWQIGLTGKTVTPDLYFAVGISGAGHHMAGCGNAKTIVAINTDPSAGIFREARFGIVGDYRKLVPALIEALNAMKRQ